MRLHRRQEEEGAVLHSGRNPGHHWPTMESFALIHTEMVPSFGDLPVLSFRFLSLP